MEFLLDNPLANMFGPYFLLFYGVGTIALLTAVSIVKRQADQTGLLPTPAVPPNVDPFEVAYLRGGDNEMARAVVFALIKKGYIEISSFSQSSVIGQVKPMPERSGLSEMERAALSWFDTARTAEEVFSADGLTHRLKPYANEYQTVLEGRQLLAESRVLATLRPVKWVAVLLIAGVGTFKLLAALANGHSNVAFLVMIGFIGTFLAFWVSDLPRVTRLGKAYLERLQIVFGDLKYESQAPYIKGTAERPIPSATFASVDPLLLSVGVFGAGILAGTAYDNYNQTFQRAQQTSSGGCGGASSGCGSSSCSSGDGGGGGCGGCGGGCS